MVAIEYIELVEELNQELYDNHGEQVEQWYYLSAGFVDVIGFGDKTLWCSENDEREWINNGDDYEPLKPFLKKELKKLGELYTKIGS